MDEAKLSVDPETGEVLEVGLSDVFDEGLTVVGWEVGDNLPLTSYAEKLQSIDEALGLLERERKEIIGRMEFIAHKQGVIDWSTGKGGYRIQLVSKPTVPKDKLLDLAKDYPELVKFSPTLNRTEFTRRWDSGIGFRDQVKELVTVDPVYVIGQETRKTAVASEGGK